MAGAVPSVNSAPSRISDVAAGVSTAIALIFVMVLVIARRSRPVRPPGVSRETGTNGRRSGLVAALRAVKSRAPRTLSDCVDVEAGHRLPAKRRPLARLWPSPTRPQVPRSARRQTPNCPICAGDYVSGSLLQELPCGHLCHPSCVARWLNEFEVTCPLCPVDLTPAYLAKAVPAPKRAVMATMQKP